MPPGKLTWNCCGWLPCMVMVMTLPPGPSTLGAGLKLLHDGLSLDALPGVQLPDAAAAWIENCAPLLTLTCTELELVLKTLTVVPMVDSLMWIPGCLAPVRRRRTSHRAAQAARRAR